MKPHSPPFQEESLSDADSVGVCVCVIEGGCVIECVLVQCKRAAPYSIHTHASLVVCGRGVLVLSVGYHAYSGMRFAKVPLQRSAALRFSSLTRRRIVAQDGLCHGCCVRCLLAYIAVVRGQRLRAQALGQQASTHIASIPVTREHFAFVHFPDRHLVHFAIKWRVI